MGPSTTFNRLPSTIPKSEKSKPLVDGLPIFRKCCYGRPLRAKRSRWAAFVAQHQTSHFGTGLFDHICQPITRAVIKARPKLATPTFSGFAKAKRQSVFNRNLGGARGGIDSRYPVHLRKWLWSQKEPEPFVYQMERATGSPRVCFANPCFAAGHCPLRAALENAHAFFSASHPAGFDSRRPAAYENGSGTK